MSKKVLCLSDLLKYSTLYCRKLLIISLILIVFTSCSDSNDDLLNPDERAWLQEHDSLAVGLFPYYPPYQFLGKTNKVEGIYVDYLELIEKKIDYKFIRKQYSNWPKLLKDANTGKVDVILEAQETENRRRFLDFNDLFFDSPYVLVTRKTYDSGTDLKDFSNKTIVLPKGFAIEDLIKTKNKNIKIITEVSDYKCLLNLTNGKSDAYIGPQVIANYYIKSRKLQNLKVASVLDFSYKPAIAISKEDVMLNKIIEKASKHISRQDRENIAHDWLLNFVKPFYLKPLFWIGLTIMGIILLSSVLVFNRMLKFKISQKTKELSLARDEVEKNLKIKTNLIQNVSHEIRTPLNGIMGFAQLLTKAEHKDFDNQKYGHAIIDCGNQLLHIIDDILEVQQLHVSKTVSSDKEYINIHELFKRLYNMFELQAAQKELALVIENNVGTEYSIKIDRSILSIILCNILNNAIKFTEEGKITIAYSIVQDTLKIDIKDTGIGIPKDSAFKVFESYEQTETEISKKNSGLGVGLSIAKQYTLALNGTINYKSIEGKGTTFTVNIPIENIKKEPEIQKDKLEKKKNDLKTKDISGPKEILIAEDNSLNFKLLEMLLLRINPNKFKISRAKNGKEAIEMALKEQNFDLILMDIKMPQVDGYEATEVIKNKFPEMIIVAQTAFSSEENKRQAFDSGCDDFLSKPIEMTELEECITKYI